MGMKTTIGQPANVDVSPVVNRVVQWDGPDMPKPKVSIIDAEIYKKSAREKQAYLAKQISDLPIDSNWKSGLHHALSKMGMFFNDAYDDVKQELGKLADVQTERT
jgi:hypothetical protein